jgi:hypothetical protein
MLLFKDGLQVGFCLLHTASRSQAPALRKPVNVRVHRKGRNPAQQPSTTLRVANAELQGQEYVRDDTVSEKGSKEGHVGPRMDLHDGAIGSLLEGVLLACRCIFAAHATLRRKACRMRWSTCQQAQSRTGPTSRFTLKRIV